MMGTKRVSKTIIIPILLMLVAVAAIALFQNISAERSRETVFSRVSFAASSQVTMVNAVLEGHFTTLNTLANGIAGSTGLMGSEEAEIMHITEMLRAVYPGTEDLHAGVAFADGLAHHVDGVCTDISLREYFAAGMRGETTTEYVSRGKISLEPRIVIAVPIMYQGQARGIVFASISERYFTERYAADSVDENGYVFVCDNNGAVLFSTGREGSPHQGENVFSRIARGQYAEGYTLDALRSNMKSGVGGLVAYERDGTSFYASYEPLPVNNWYIFNVVPGSTVDAEYASATKDGETTLTIVIFCASAIILYFVISDMRRIREIRSEKHELEKNEVRLRAFLEQTDGVVFEYDVELGCARLYGSLDALGGAIDGLCGNITREQFCTRMHPDDVPEFMSIFDELALTGQSKSRAVRLKTRNDDYLWCGITLSPVFISTDFPSLYIGRITDISAERTEVDNLRKRAQTDLLTGLLNHDATFAFIRDYIAGAGKNDVHALMMIDLDNFKSVNDNLGHSVGDDALKKISSQIRSLFRSTDIVGRVGGDEFLVLLKNVPTTEFVRLKAQELCESLQFTYAGEMCIDLTSSIGVALYKHGRPFDELYKAADAAMYLSKNRGKNRYMLIDEDMPDESAIARSVAAEARSNAVQLNALMQYMESGVLVLEMQETSIHTLYVSPSFYKITGSSAESFAALKSVIDLIHPDYSGDFEAQLRKCAYSSDALDMTVRASDALKPGWRHIRAVRIPYESSRYPVMLVVSTDITAIKMQERALEEDRKRLELSIDQTDIMMWTFDVRKNELSNTKSGEMYTNLPDCLFERSIVHKDSQDEYRRFVNAALAGEEEHTCVVRMKYHSADYKYFKNSFKMIYNEAGKPVTAVGISIPLPNIAADKAIFDQEETIHKSIAPEMLASAKINITRGIVETFYCQANSGFSGSKYGIYESLLKRGAQLCAFEEERAVLYSRASRTYMNLSFERGSTLLFFEYRQLKPDGRIRWVSLVTSLLKEPVTGDLYAFMYLRNIDKRKRSEIAARTHVERDNITLLYSQTTFREIVSSMLAVKPADTAYCMLAIAELSGLDTMDEDLGTGIVRNILLTCGRMINALTPADMIIGRVGRNKFGFFVLTKNGEADALSYAKALGIKLMSVRILAPLNLVTAIYSGVTIERANGTDYDTLHDHAIAACETSRESNRFSTYYSLDALKHIVSATPGLPEGTQTNAAQPGMTQSGATQSGADVSPADAASAQSHGMRDELTGVLSRQAYHRYIEDTTGDTLISLGALFIDINGLAKLNHDYGADYGDGMLSFIGHTLMQEFSDMEIFRLSGDEFLCLAADISHDEFVKKCSAAEADIDFTYPNLICTGVTWTDRDIDIQKLVDNAEGLMQLGKQEYYLDIDAVDSRHRAELLKRLQKNILDDRFQVFLQPKADVGTGRLVGAEALVRLVDPERGVISPGEFVPVYEKERIIRFLDLHVFEKTVATLRRFIGEGRPALTISINFSRSTLLAPDTLETALAIVAKYGVPTGIIEIEVTETVGGLDRATAIAACEKFRDAGFKLSLDDYGSKYSSMYMLSAVRFDAVKIDKSIIDDITTNKLSRIQVDNTLRICAEIGAQCVAEGVETEEQLAALHSLGCGIVQGYLIDRPLDIGTFEGRWL